MAKLGDGRIPVIAGDFPSFLFDQYNPNDIEEGLLKGFLLVRVRHTNAIVCIGNSYMAFRYTSIFSQLHRQLFASHQV